jgi:hypothetical protein
MITPEQAAAMLRSTTRTIYSWVEAAIIHFSEQPQGSLLICLDSLPVDDTGSPCSAATPSARP